MAAIVGVSQIRIRKGYEDREIGMAAATGDLASNMQRLINSSLIRKLLQDRSGPGKWTRCRPIFVCIRINLRLPYYSVRSML